MLLLLCDAAWENVGPFQRLFVYALFFLWNFIVFCFLQINKSLQHSLRRNEFVSWKLEIHLVSHSPRLLFCCFSFFIFSGVLPTLVKDLKIEKFFAADALLSCVKVACWRGNVRLQREERWERLRVDVEDEEMLRFQGMSAIKEKMLGSKKMHLQN